MVVPTDERTQWPSSTRYKVQLRRAMPDIKPIRVMHPDIRFRMVVITDERPMVAVLFLVEGQAWLPYAGY